jgi:hypothetical protein
MTALCVNFSDVCNNIHFSIVFFLGFCVAATEAHGLKKILMEVGVNKKNVVVGYILSSLDLS